MCDIKSCLWSESSQEEDEGEEIELPPTECYCSCCCKQPQGCKGWTFFLGGLVATAVLVAGFSTDHWVSVTVTALNVLDEITHEPMVLSRTYIGLWRECDITPTNNTCQYIDVLDQNGWYQGVMASAIVGLISAIMSLVVHFMAKMHIVAILFIITGVIAVVEVAIFAVKIHLPESNETEVMSQGEVKVYLRMSTHLDWSFYFTVVSAAVYLLVGIATEVYVVRNGMETKDEDKEDANQDMTCLVPQSTWTPPRDFDAGFI